MQSNSLTCLIIIIRPTPVSTINEHVQSLLWSACKYMFSLALHHGPPGPDDSGGQATEMLPAHMGLVGPSTVIADAISSVTLGSAHQGNF